MAEHAEEIIFKIVTKNEQCLAFIEKVAVEVLPKPLTQVRKEIENEVGDLLPAQFLFLFKGIPVSKEQEKKITLEKCAIVKDDESYAIFIDETPRFLSENSSRAPTTQRESVTGGCVDGSHPFNATSSQMKNELSRLEEELDIAKAKLQSLEDFPPPRPWHGSGNFTCTNCHYKGHKMSKPCRLPACKGFHECGILTMHQEHKVEISKAKSNLKNLERKVKQKKEEIDSFNLMKDRTKGNFFSVMRPKVIAYDPIRYSNRQVLENDLRILAAALKHKVPDGEIDVEDIITKKKNECNKYKHSNEDYEETDYVNKEHKRSRQELSLPRKSLHYETDCQRRNKRDRGHGSYSQHQTKQRISDRRSSHYSGQSSGTPSSFRQSDYNLNVSNHSRYLSPQRNTSRHTSTPMNTSRNAAHFQLDHDVSPSQSPITTARSRFNFSQSSANLFDYSAGSSDSRWDNSFSREAANVLANMGRQKRSVKDDNYK